LISFVRDASYTTQPLELLNSLGFQKSNNQQLLSRKAESDSHGNSYHGNRGEVSISNGEHSHPELNPQTSLDNSEGILIYGVPLVVFLCPIFLMECQHEKIYTVYVFI